MCRVIYLAPFPRIEITGGIKMAFRHVELLQAIGIDARVHSPDGMPTWFVSRALLTTAANARAGRGDVLVFPEVLSGPLVRAALAPAPATKALLCQNQYNIFNELIPRFTYQQLGFAKFMTVSEVARGFLERLLAPATFEVLPVLVDEKVFFPRRKELRIAVAPRKLQSHYQLIHKIFVTKFPQLRRVPWDVMVGRSESEVAETLGRAAIFLSLSHLESVGLIPLEAMASGCVVVGFHGYGGLEYATKANGVWTRPDYLEETADALAAAVVGIDRGDEYWQTLRAAGETTARRFNRGALEQALKKAFGAVGTQTSGAQ
jgi:Glycosyl transferases group 1